MKKNNALFLPMIACLLACAHAFAQPAGSPKPQLNHVAFYVSDLQKSSSFYHDIIGLDTIPEPFHDGKHVWLRTGPKSELHLILGAAEGTEHNKNNHLCFAVPSLEDFIRALQQKKVGYENWPGDKNVVSLRVDGVKQIYFRDPDGYWIEINNAKE